MVVPVGKNDSRNQIGSLISIEIIWFWMVGTKQYILITDDKVDAVMVVVSRAKRKIELSAHRGHWY